MKLLAYCAIALLLMGNAFAAPPSKEQLAKWLKRFPAADTNKDGVLSVEEANAFRNKLRSNNNRSRGVTRSFKANPGWDAERFPDHAACYLSPEELKEANGGSVQTFPKPTDGAKRIVGTGHSFMAPGYKTLPLICKAAGFEQPMHLHTGGGMTGSTRYKWEQENGIFQFDGKAKPRLLSAIANGEWEAMIWGPYYQDRPVYYTCWIDFCLKYNPNMKFYLSDAWPQIGQLGKMPTSEDVLTAETMTRLGKETREIYAKLITKLNEKHSGRVFVLPTCDAMVLAVQHYHRGELPGIEGINRAIGKKTNSIWRDPLGHLGPGFERLEGYVFYATVYGRSPELIKDKIAYNRGQPVKFPSAELDSTFRKIAWQAVINNPQSGVVDKDGDGIADVND